MTGEPAPDARSPGGGDELIDMPDGAIRVPRTDRAAGLGHVRRGIRRRASLAPLLFLVGTVVVVVGLVALRGADRLDSSLAAWTIGPPTGDPSVRLVVVIENNGDDEATVLSTSLNASGPVRSSPAVLVLESSPDLSVDVSTQPHIPPGDTATISWMAEFDCVEGDVFELAPVVRVEVRQRFLNRVSDEPDGPFLEFTCVDGVPVPTAAP